MEYHNLFSHIYIEEEVEGDPFVKEISARFKNSSFILIENYKQIFNRSGQNWNEQKKSRKLILGKRHDNFLYDASGYVSKLGAARFFYNTLMMNCLYDCEYCYLQGMYPGANVVAFVNNTDYLNAARRELENGGPYTLALSYDSDLLAFENIFGYCRKWIEFAGQVPGITLEIRTKSININSIKGLKPVPNAVLAWTLSPQEVASAYEHKVPDLASRLDAVNKSLEQGWNTRICIDPVIKVANWRSIYSDFIETVAGTVNLDRINDISVGLFRMNHEFLKRIQKKRPDSAIYHENYQRKGDLSTYSEDESVKIQDLIKSCLTRYLPIEKIHQMP